MPDTEKTMTQFLSLRDSQPSGKWPPVQSGDKKMKGQRVTDYRKTISGQWPRGGGGTWVFYSMNLLQRTCIILAILKGQ